MTGNHNGIDVVKCICFFNANMFLVIKKQKTKWYMINIASDRGIGTHLAYGSPTFFY